MAQCSYNVSVNNQNLSANQLSKLSFICSNIQQYTNGKDAFLQYIKPFIYFISCAVFICMLTVVMFKLRIILQGKCCISKKKREVKENGDYQ